MCVFTCIHMLQHAYQSKKTICRSQFSLPCGLQVLNLGAQLWWEALLPAEPSCNLLSLLKTDSDIIAKVGL